jgi:peptide-methionine (S)-S-oxide reductase/peptide methionine sulfoxide reductase msrA/msrB
MKTSYEKLLLLFFKLHDPTSENRQGNDVGTQYRSVIFYADEGQKTAAEKIKAQVQKSGAWKKPVVTQIEKAKTFYPAEDEHQKYLKKHPDGYTCHFVRDLKF